MVNFMVKGDNNDDKQTCPARIMAFVNVCTNGFPRPGSDDPNWKSNLDSTDMDDNLYAIIHAASHFCLGNQWIENSLFRLLFLGT